MKILANINKCIVRFCVTLVTVHTFVYIGKIMLTNMHKTDYELLPFDECNKIIYAPSLTPNKSLIKHYYTNALLSLERPDFSEILICAAQNDEQV